MAVRFLGYEVNGKLQEEPPKELIERVRKAFEDEFGIECEDEKSDEQRKVG